MREIENALLANCKRLYHFVMEAVAKSTLSEAMNRRNPEIFKALFEELLDCVMAFAPKHKLKFKNPLLGASADPAIIPLLLPINPGDHFYFYSNDMIEIQNAGGEKYGRERLLDVIFSSGNNAAETIQAVRQIRRTESRFS